MKNQITDTQSIEPYGDQQVKNIIQTLIDDKEFHLALSSQLYPKLTKIAPQIATSFFKYTFSRYFSASNSIIDFQNSLVPFVRTMIKRTTNGFTYSGKENLSSKPTLFIGNHRDIALDALFLNYARYLEGFKTVRIAIGDNLLDGRFFEKLMRLNKSFVVYRNIKGIKETITKLKNLSSFINRSIDLDNESIWIAQKEGRANDGNDFTDKAVLKMLYLYHKKELSLEEWVSRVNLTPISISYEYDPLDVTKAKGWKGWENLSNDENNKRDLEELVKGIRGKKGRVHLHICKNVNNCPETIEKLSVLIDNEIRSNYKLWPTNYVSALELNWINKNSMEKEKRDPKFLSRFKGLSKDLKKEVLKIYATPYMNSKKRGQ